MDITSDDISPLGILIVLGAAGFNVHATANDLRVAPRRLLSPELVRAIQRLKPELLALADRS